MNALFELIGIPLGYVLWFIYKLVSNYFLAVFLFTFVVRAATFPISLKSQKSQADRARLAPRLERIQKKYAKDPQKLREKQTELYEKEGVSLTGGCLPMILQMVILFGVIAVIYAPLTHLARIPTAVIDAGASAVTLQDQEVDPNKVPARDMQGYYKELRFLMVIEDNREEVLAAIEQVDPNLRRGVSAQEYYDQMLAIRSDFVFGNRTLLENPWDSEKGFAGINILWLIPLISGLISLLTSMLSMHYSKAMTGSSEQMAGQGCSNGMMLVMMPMFSLIMSFIVPGGVGVYWICSNVIALLQTFLLNKIYNPAKIRAQAEKEYEERRQRKAEDKRRLKEARLREEEEARLAAKREEEEKEQARLEAANSRKKPVEPSKNPNKQRRREAAAEAAAEATETAAPEVEASGETAEE